MVNYDYKFLKDKGFFKNQREYDENGTNIIVDMDNYIVYVEVNNDDKLNELKKAILEKYPKIDVIYFHYPADNKIKVFRKWGEVKWFYYSDNLRNDRKKSKKDKLKKFAPDNVSILFDIKDVMDRFYKDLWVHRLEMAKSITEPLTDSDKLFIAQHFIDRLVFFYFLAQLGIININIKYKGELHNIKLNKKGTREFFNYLLNIVGDEGLHYILNKIFFNGLGNGEDVDKNGFVVLSFSIKDTDIDIKVPYLNGGLYRVKKFNDIDETEIKFNGLKNLIETLNKYNWVIGDYTEEDDDSIGSISPEIMGHVYEKFVVGLENIGEIELDKIEIGKEVKIGRKKVGAFYTPEEITKYISKNTITPYLFDKLEVSKHYKDFDDFVDNASKEELKKALSVLNDIKILDPACGSGHFLVCAGELLFNMKNTICNKLYEKDGSFIRKHNAYDEVKNIIVNNLCGVDICNSAVEIAKLRLWLWLVSQLKDDSSKLEPLPNLEYNIKCGNSLIGWVDEPLVLPNYENDSLINRKKIEEKLNELNSLIIEEKLNKLNSLKVCEDEKEKNELNSLIKVCEDEKEKIEKVRKLLNKKVGTKKREKFDDIYVEAFHLLYLIYRTSHGGKAGILKTILEEIRKEIYNVINNCYLNYINSKLKAKDKISEKDFLNLNPFHWRIDFGWIVKNGGFDIVIGNPPYGNLLSNVEKLIVEKIYMSDTSEIAGVFVERGINVLENNGYLSYIITFAITFNKKLSKTREILRKNFEKIFISSFDRDKCRFFEGMSQSVSILRAKIKKINGGGTFYTSKMFREMPKNLNNIKYSPANEYLLLNNEDIGNRFDIQHRLPKIGGLLNLKILDTLLKNTNKAKNVIGTGCSTIWIRTSGNYWYNAWDKKPYESTEIKSMSVKEVWSNFIMLFMNSSLFYWWFRIYGDGRHMNMDILKAIPLPNEDTIKKDAKLLECVRNITMDKLFSVFDSGRNRFNTSDVKGYLDLIDLIIGKKYYNLQPYEIIHILNTDYEVRGGIKLYSPFYELIHYLAFLTLKKQKEDTDTINFMDIIINNLIYELYFKEKFYEDKIYNEPKEYLLEAVSKHLEPINYDKWAELYWKKQLENNLTSEEEQELKQLEENNIKTVKEVYNSIKEDKEINELINKIKSHKWVKIIECVNNSI
ncbi:Eco57I restriction-modification methylase domain-containing protein [Methanothermococcus okinawensis]|uniref:site-specific DNA-methyltransferase (adenine-specific) n=1 Tax=Methanothermococcus okinawensis (strain DSM 14208 / JCM 11175 / IH1) TaxID=647113 RepID=F8AP18_METOI|nr:DNA methyltransferase [Methanothermococcus okinawensis]AEH07586.1 hypothetical protein Metok_1624 [Methanothermococcus okinawensis IH1]